MNHIDLTGRIVTGAARGIGFACAERLLASGANIVLWDVESSRLDRAVATLKAAGTVHGFPIDVTNEPAVSQAAATAEAALGKVDILINNAGIIGAYAPTWEYPPREWRKVIEVDLTAAYLCCRAVVPGMIARHYGRIVNMASVADQEGNPGSPAYSAAKAGLIGFTKSLGKELATSGVIVNCVTPTVARTDLLAQARPRKFNASLPRSQWAASSRLKKLPHWLLGSPQPTATHHRGCVRHFRWSGNLLGRSTH